MNSTISDAYKKLKLPVKESYETLKANIRLYDFGTKNIKTLTITSCRAGEGKTTTACNLAVSMVKSGLKVLIVDADLHKPELMKELKGDNNLGLSNVLLGYAELNEAINFTSIENLHYISCGVTPINPAVLLGSAEFKELMATVCDQYDMVIFDTPPLASVIDSMIVASQTDGTILVIQPGKVHYKNIEMVKDQLQKSKINLLGVVLNKIPAVDYREYYMDFDYYDSNKKYREWLNKIIKRREN